MSAIDDFPGASPTWEQGERGEDSQFVNGSSWIDEAVRSLLRREPSRLHANMRCGEAGARGRELPWALFKCSSGSRF